MHALAGREMANGQPAAFEAASKALEEAVQRRNKELTSATCKKNSGTPEMNVFDLISFLRVRPTLGAPLGQTPLTLCSLAPLAPLALPIQTNLTGWANHASGNILNVKQRTSRGQDRTSNSQGCFC